MARTPNVPFMRSRAEMKAGIARLGGAQARVATTTATTTDPADGGDGSSAAAGTVGELWLYGVVGGWWSGFDAEGVADALRGMDVDQLYVRIHSPGGLASDGVAISNLLRNHRAKVTTIVDGLAASAASIIALAGDEVVMCPGSQMMLHDAMTGVYGNAQEIRLVADWIDGQSQNYAGVYAYRAGGTPEQWREVMQANDFMGTWYTAEAAVAAKLADEVGTRTAIGSPPTGPEDALEELDDETWARALHDVELLDRCVHASAQAAWAGERPKPPTASAGGSITTQEGSTAVAFTDAQLTTMRQELGLPEDADEATIVAALSEALEERAESTAAADTTKIPEGHVVIPQAKLDDLTAGAEAGRKAAEKLHLKERKEFLDANRTKFAPASRAAWETEYDRDPEAVRKHFAEAPDIIPAEMLGHEHDADEETSSDVVAQVRESDAYKNWSVA